MANGSDPFDLLPNEIWDKVLEWLTDPNDLINFMDTCTSFYKLLKHKRTCFIFPQVFKIITENYNIKKSDHVDMLVCRSVSKLWKEGVDNHYQNLPYFSLVDYHAFYEEALKCITAFLCRLWNDPFSIDFELSPRGLPQLKRKLDEWRNSPSTANPFLSRHLAIYDSEETLRDDAEGLIANMEMMEYTMEMLKNFGNHVWYLAILLHMRLPSTRYLMLINWLKHTPNLKVLSLYFRAGDEDFENVIEENPFPEMEQLTVFQGDKVPNAVLKSVLKSNPQIEKLQNQGAPSLSPFTQPNLTQVLGQYHILASMERNTAKFSQLEKLTIDFHVTGKGSVQYKKGLLHSCKFLTGNNKETSENCEIQVWKHSNVNNTVFTMLERFENTLVHFKLGVLEEQSKTNNASFSCNAACIDLILPLRSWSLKSLQVSAKCRDGYRWIDEKDAVNQLFAYLQGRLHESTIWKLPEMKQVFVVDGCDGYLTIFI